MFLSTGYIIVVATIEAGGPSAVFHKAHQVNLIMMLVMMMIKLRMMIVMIILIRLRMINDQQNQELWSLV